MRTFAARTACSTAREHRSCECSACAPRRHAEHKADAPAVGGRQLATARDLHDFASVSVERKDGVVHGPAGGANRFADCPAQWKPAANAAQRLGSNWLQNVVNGLTTLPKPIPAPVANLLTRHFHTTFDKDL